MATCLSLRYLAAALVAGLGLSLLPVAPAAADEPGYRQPRVRVVTPRVYAPRVHAPVVHVRTVERVRTRVICYDYTGQTFDCRTPAPVAPVYQGCGGCAPVVYQAGCCTPAAPVYYATRYHAPRYYAAGCGGCAQPVAAPYYWAVRHARYRHAYPYHY